MEAASLLVHITAGTLAIVAGYIAIFAAKGAMVHRRAGMLFVQAMVVMGLTGTIVALVRNIPGSVGGGIMAVYFTVTAWTAVRPIHRRLDIAMFVVALTLATLTLGGLAAGQPSTSGAPPAMRMFLGTVLLLCAMSDLRWLRGLVTTGTGRVTRHLWRMCFAFFVATGSFFLGQMDEFPAWLQNAALMAVPALMPLVLMLYWLWRVRIRRVVSGLVLRRA